MPRRFVFVLMLIVTLISTGCGSRDQQNALVQQGNTTQQSSNIKKADTAKNATVQQTKDKQYVGDTEDDKLKLKEYALNAPTTKLVIQLPPYIQINLSPQETHVQELKAITSMHGTEFPAQGEYIGRPNNDTKFFFWTSYVSFDVKAVEKKIGQPFSINLDGAVYSYIGDMEKNYDVKSAVETIAVGGLDARLVTLRYIREGYPSIQKAVFVSRNDDMWQIRFICIDDGSNTYKEIELISEMLHNLKLENR